MTIVPRKPSYDGERPPWLKAVRRRLSPDGRVRPGEGLPAGRSGSALSALAAPDGWAGARRRVSIDQINTALARMDEITPQNSALVERDGSQSWRLTKAVLDEGKNRMGIASLHPSYVLLNRSIPNGRSVI
jgi:hypothetical protein